MNAGKTRVMWCQVCQAVIKGQVKDSGVHLCGQGFWNTSMSGLQGRSWSHIILVRSVSGVFIKNVVASKES